MSNKNIYQKLIKLNFYLSLLIIFIIAIYYDFLEMGVGCYMLIAFYRFIIRHIFKTKTFQEFLLSLLSKYKHFETIVLVVFILLTVVFFTIYALRYSGILRVFYIEGAITRVTTRVHLYLLVKKFRYENISL